MSARIEKKKTSDTSGVTTGIPPEASQTIAALPIVGIGASAGGLEAFKAFFAAMPNNSGIAFVLVPHLDPSHVSIMPELIQKQTEMQVLQIKDGMRAEPNVVYIVPPNQELSILNGALHLMELGKPHGVNLPINNFFRALALDQGSNAVGIILSGTGSDGSLGVKAIKGEAGMVMVQDEQTAQYEGMPRSAIATGIVDYILPPASMPEQLIKYLQHAVRTTNTESHFDNDIIPNTLQKICIILRARTGHDFSQYKKNTILRRIERRMHVHQIDEIKDYVSYLQKSEIEGDILFKELLIGVTNFFRDAKAFEALQETILPDLLEDKPDDYTLRVWVTGCSSGEEAYSIAILLHEVIEKIKRPINVQIFGTDIDSDAIDVARTGVFPAGIAADVSKARLKRWFTREDNQYRIKKTIREMLVFAVQSVIKDPPFTKLDLICCRNLLIYFGQELQKKLIPKFHYSLKTNGILFLGSSESIGHFQDLFKTLDKKWKIFRREAMSVSDRHVLQFPVSPAMPESLQLQQSESVKKIEELSAFQLMETILNQVTAPPCVIIDEGGDIIYLHGRTGRYLEPSIGKINVNILKMARPGLGMDLSSAIRKVVSNKQEVTCKGLSIENDGGPISIDLIVKPIQEPNSLHGLILVIFKEIDVPAKNDRVIKKNKARVRASTVGQLEQELQSTKENLFTTIEELKTSNEELKSANEELQSSNEELQSTNEELETSKEELQSLNEEAATVNAELQSRIDELSATNDDMKNLLDSTQIATIFLDLNLCIRKFTPKAVEIIPLTTIDSGRPISHFATALTDIDLTKYAHEVLQNLGIQEKEVQSKEGIYFRMRIRPYRTVNNVIDGVVITFEDITALKETQSALSKLNLELEQQKQSSSGSGIRKL